MLVTLTHPFIWRCKDPNFLLEDCEKVNTFLKRLEDQAKSLVTITEQDTEQEKSFKMQEVNKYKGDGFELLTEAVIRLFPCDKRIGLIENYTVNTITDVGVDGYGISGYNKKPITVQCKYRQSDHVLEANKDHLTNFTSASMMHFKVDQTPDPKTGKCNMIIFTSGDSLNFFTDEKMFGNMVYAFCRKDFRQLLDNNNTFWKLFAQSWAESLAQAKA